MSIIFNKLQQSTEPEQGLKKRLDSDFSKKQESNRLQRFVFSPSGAVISLLFIALIGTLTYFSIYYLKVYVDQSKPVAWTQRPTSGSDGLPNNGMPSDLDTAYAKNLHQAPTTGLPELRENEKQPEGAISTDADSPPLPGEEDPEQAQFQPKLNHQDTDAGQPSKLPSMLTSDKEPKKSTATPVEPETIKKAEKPSPSREEIAEQKNRLARQKRVKAVSNIALLVKEIETLLKRGDYQKAESLIQTLSTLKQSENPYLMKLKAFIEIKSNRLDTAAHLLNEVLKHHPDDLEAGINMAVIEIKQHRTDLAKNRLIRLREQHPDNSSVAMLLSRL